MKILAHFSMFVVAVTLSIVGTLSFPLSAYAVQQPSGPRPTPTPTYRPATKPPVYQPKAAPSPTGTPAIKPPVYTRPTAEILTSVDQITDIKPTDFAYKGLKVLIEKYGVAGLTVNRRFLQDQALLSDDYRTIVQSAKTQLRQVASAAGISDARFEGLFGSRCSEPRVSALGTMLAGEVVDTLKCRFGPADLTALYPGQLMRRGNFVQVFTYAVENIAEKIGAVGVSSPAKSELMENFDDNRNTWPVAENAGAATSINDGLYRLGVKFDAVMTVVPRREAISKLNTARDFALETEFTFVDGEPGDSFSLVWGVSADRKRRYSFGLLQNGSFFTGKHSGGIWVKEINARTHKAPFNGRGTPNKLALKKTGGVIELFINGYKVGSEAVAAADTASSFGFELNGQSTVTVNYLKVVQN